MSEVQAVADRVSIEARHGEFTGAVMMRDHDRVASMLVVRRADLRSPVARPQPAGGIGTAVRPLTCRPETCRW